MASLLAHLDKYKKEGQLCLFVILVAEPNEVKADILLREIKETYSKEIFERGLIEVISVDPHFYPPIAVASKTSEPEIRVFWRTKQNLDTLYLMHFCQNLAKFYVHLEDDVTTRVCFHCLCLSQAANIC